MKCRTLLAASSIAAALALSGSVTAQTLDVVTARAIETSIGPPGAVTTDASGNVYFSTPHLVYKLDVNGGLTRVAGSGQAGFSGDGGLAVNAQFNFPTYYPERDKDSFDFQEMVGALAVDSAGNLYIADAYNNRVRRVDRTGIVTTIAGDGTGGYSGDGGPAAKAQFWWPQGVAASAAGFLYIADLNGTLRRVGPDGIITTLTAGNCGRSFLSPGLCAPEAIAVDSSDNVFVPDGYCRVRVVRPDGSVMTVAGNDRRPEHGNPVTCGYSGDGGAAVDAALANTPYGVAVVGNGDVYIADTFNNCVRKVDAAGIITTFAGVCRSTGYSGDGGPATSAKLWQPHGVAADAMGNIYIADTLNNRIRKVALDGVITTVAGNGGWIATVLAALPPAPTTVNVVEYYNAALDHYFMTWLGNEIAILDAGIQIKGWQRTGQSFRAYTTARAGTSDICRFEIPLADSHFYGRDSTECAATGAAHPDFVLEDPKFMAMILPTAGVCPANTTEVYRVFDNRPDANHRYMTDKSVAAQMVAKGWIAEGDGANLVVMCAPDEG